MQVEPVGNRGYGKAPTEWTWAFLSALFLFACLMIMPAGVQMSWPDEGFAGRMLAFTAPILTAGYFLWRSSQVTRLGRLLYGLAILPTLFLAALPLNVDFWARGTYPWSFALPMVSALLVGAWICHQRWLVLAIPAFLVWWLWGAFQSPVTSIPESQAHDGITVKLVNVTPKGCQYQVIGDTRSLVSQIDPDLAILDAHLGSTIGVRSWKPHYVAETNTYYCTTFAPAWARSVDLDITVPLIPKDAAAAIVIPLKEHLPTTLKENGTNGMLLEAGELHWIQGARRSLAVTITCSNYDEGWTLNDERFIDNQGRLLDVTQDHGLSTERSSTTTEELYDLPPDVKSIGIESFSAAQVHANELVFHFRRVPLR